MDKQLRFLFFQIENLVSSNNQISTKLLFSYFDLHGVSDKTKRQKIFKNLAQSATTLLRNRRVSQLNQNLSYI